MLLYFREKSCRSTIFVDFFVNEDIGKGFFEAKVTTCFYKVNYVTTLSPKTETLLSSNLSLRDANYCAMYTVKSQNRTKAL